MPEPTVDPRLANLDRAVGAALEALDLADTIIGELEAPQLRIRFSAATRTARVALDMLDEDVAAAALA